MVAPYLRDNRVEASELIPVCCYCRRERSGAGEWREHVPVAGERLTHGICPGCFSTLYPDLVGLLPSNS